MHIQPFCILIFSFEGDPGESLWFPSSSICVYVDMTLCPTTVNNNQQIINFYPYKDIFERYSYGSIGTMLRANVMYPV